MTDSGRDRLPASIWVTDRGRDRLSTSIGVTDRGRDYLPQNRDRLTPNDDNRASRTIYVVMAKKNHKKV